MPEELTGVGRGVTICHESFGDPADPPVLLVMGLGVQMIAWHEDFCRLLAGQGFYVTRFDNRDVGHSTHFDFPPPTTGQLLRRRFRPEQYGLEEMADDTAGLIEALDLAPVHLVGISMGGMVSQTLAARRPELVRSFASISSNTGSRLNGQPAFGLYRHLLAGSPRDREELVEQAARLFALIGSRDLGVDIEDIRELAGRSYDRDRDPGGYGRQLGGITKTRNRTPMLRTIKAPTVVIHGTKDRLIKPSGGKATAKAIPGAKLVRIEGMGHDLPRAAWDRIIGEILGNAARAAPDLVAVPAALSTR